MKPQIKDILILAILNLSATSGAFAAELNIRHGSNDELVLSGLSCSKLIEQRDALCQWKKTLDSTFNYPASTSDLCKTNSRGISTVSVLSCLPDFPKKYAAKTLARNGPNCWGTAMSFHGLAQKPRFLWDQEMMYWMETPVCRKLEVGEAKQAGDVVNVFYPEFMSEEDSAQPADPGTNFWEALYPGRYSRLNPASVQGYTGYHGLLHSVTWITPELAFGKDSPSKEDQFYFHRMGEVYGRPRGGEVNGVNSGETACQENQALSPYLREYQQPPRHIKGSSCSYFSVAYRCGSIPAYFSQQNLSPADQALWTNIQTLQTQAAKLFPMILSLSNTIASNEVTRLLALSDSTVQKDQQALSTPHLDKTTEMLLTLEYFTAAGIRKTLDQAIHGN